MSLRTACVVGLALVCTQVAHAQTRLQGVTVDTARPRMPDGFVWPKGAGVRTVQAAGDSMTPLYDNLVLIELADSAVGSSVRNFLSGLRGTIVGGFPRAGYYVIEIPAVRDYATLLKTVEALRASPVVAGAMSAPFGEAAGRPFAAPSGVGVESQRSSVGPASSSTPVSDTTRPAIPNVRFDGADSAFVVASPTPGFSYFRRFAGIKFHESVAGLEIRRYLREYGLTITGGFPGSGTYIVRFADPGPTFSDFKRWMDALGADARVKFVVPLEHSTPPPDLR